MKKILALALALMMVLSLSACGGGNDTPTPSGGEDNTPSNSEQQEQPSSTPDEGDKDDEQGAAQTFEWPTADYISEGMKYTGAGDIVFTEQEDDYGGYPATWIYINGVSVEDVAAYVDALKACGFAYLPFYPGNAAEEEPAIETDESGNCDWYGVIPGECYISITYFGNGRSYGEVINDDYVELPYQLKIAITTQTVESGRIAL